MADLQPNTQWLSLPDRLTRISPQPNGPGQQARDGDPQDDSKPSPHASTMAPVHVAGQWVPDRSFVFQTSSNAISTCDTDNSSEGWAVFAPGTQKCQDGCCRVLPPGVLRLSGCERTWAGLDNRCPTPRGLSERTNASVWVSGCSDGIASLHEKAGFPLEKSSAALFRVHIANPGWPGHGGRHCWIERFRCQEQTTAMAEPNPIPVLVTVVIVWLAIWAVNMGSRICMARLTS